MPDNQTFRLGGVYGEDGRTGDLVLEVNPGGGVRVEFAAYDPQPGQEPQPAPEQPAPEQLPAEPGPATPAGEQAPEADPTATEPDEPPERF